MKKITLKLGEILELNQELIKLVSEDLAYKTKYWINKLGIKVSKEAEYFQKLNIEIFKKYGSDDGNGNWTVQPDSKDFAKFQKQLSELLEQEVEIEHGEFKLEDLEFKSENNYLQFSRLISE